LVLFGHIGDDISKNRKKNYTGLQRGIKIQFKSNLVLNSVCPVLSFLERFQPITATMCAVAIIVLDLKMSFVKPAVNGKRWGTRSRLAFLLKSQEIEFLIALTCFHVVVCGIGPRPCKILANKVIRNVRQRRHWKPLFGPVWSHRGRHFQKRKKKYTALQQGIKTQFSSKFGAKLSLPCPFFS